MGGAVATADISSVRPEARSGSFESFMQGHCARLVQTLTMVSLDREVAADAAQEAFIQLYLRWNRLGEYRDPVAWLYRVGINRCRDYRRFLSRTARVVERLGSQGDPDTAGDDLVDWDPDPDFASIFRSLPKRQRIAATLYYLNDLSVGEIARIMGISEGAVNSHLHRAREALKGLVEA
jgi:RNA polymerase sigma-70 factor, ECF subfamily